MISLLLKTPQGKIALAVLVAAVIGYIGWLHLSISGLELTISKKQNEIQALSSAIEYQNKAISRWKSEADDKQQQAAQALEKAEKEGKRADALLSKIKQKDAVTCSEGVQLIDEALGL